MGRREEVTGTDEAHPMGGICSFRLHYNLPTFDTGIQGKIGRHASCAVLLRVARNSSGHPGTGICSIRNGILGSAISTSRLLYLCHKGMIFNLQKKMETFYQCFWKQCI
jgi:hypothetical protein